MINLWQDDGHVGGLIALQGLGNHVRDISQFLDGLADTLFCLLLDNDIAVKISGHSAYTDICQLRYIFQSCYDFRPFLSYSVKRLTDCLN